MAESVAKPIRGNHDVMSSMAKAILIMMMVTCHAGAPFYLHNIIHLVCLPGFFFLSGMLFKENYFDSPLKYIARKLRTHYFTYIKWSLIFLALHEVFVKAGVIDELYSISDYLHKLLYIFTMSETELLLGPFWFLKRLFYSSIIVYFALKIFRIRRPVWALALSVAFLLIALFTYYTGYYISTIGADIYLSCAFFTAGYAYKKSSYSWLRNRWVAIPAVAAIMIIAIFYHGTMDVIGADMPIYYLVGLVGCVGVVNSVQFIPERARPAFDFVGSRTIYILIFHVLCFKLVAALQIWHLGMGWEHLSDFPIIETDNLLYWIAYTAVGLLVPLGLLEGYRAIASRIRKLTLSPS